MLLRIPTGEQRGDLLRRCGRPLASQRRGLRFGQLFGTGQFLVLQPSNVEVVATFPDLGTGETTKGRIRRPLTGLLKLHISQPPAVSAGKSSRFVSPLALWADVAGKSQMHNFKTRNRGLRCSGLAQNTTPSATGFVYGTAESD